MAPASNKSVPDDVIIGLLFPFTAKDGAEKVGPGRLPQPAHRFNPFRAQKTRCPCQLRLARSEAIESAPQPLFYVNVRGIQI